MNSPQVSKMKTAEGLLSMALINRKLTNAKRVPRNFGSRQNKIQKNKLFLFPELQETLDAPVVLEFMKITQSNLQFNPKQNCQEKSRFSNKITKKKKTPIGEGNRKISHIRETKIYREI